MEGKKIFFKKIGYFISMLCYFSYSLFILVSYSWNYKVFIFDIWAGFPRLVGGLFLNWAWAAHYVVEHSEIVLNLDLSITCMLGESQDIWVV